ncbi:zinc finger protein 532-like [Mercenaria mercenaria]|uniref:zinc finger protein 532-like n=1 Tax=Mercenaria mercenaria TaxID=6596 RepID=UPI00234F0B7B|nr:zinc finger protein 532-like [Mercenaria mercenaria]XP_045180956.2 zinc finger protein 532-like [Mercenaria mercenaria]XP_045180957.2 zinc finger protein 532-like [Mercenaria mercenaria]XP_045180958.2 zinc finger protein 532-like [Mercenaria mercenaria]XP_045180959.2 zinc finger protein 532-like [Mercenaria mercenaria]
MSGSVPLKTCNINIYMEPEKKTDVKATGPNENGEAKVKVENTEDGTTTVLETSGKTQNVDDSHAENKENNEVTTENVDSVPADDKENKEETAENSDNGQSAGKENKENEAQNVDNRKIDDKEDMEVNDINEEREVTPESSEFIEFEFSPIKKESSVRRDRSSSPDAEAVLDQLYEAAQSGDSGKLCNLMFSDTEMAGQETQDENESRREKSGEKAARNSHDINQNRAIINLLKRKTPIEKERIVADFESSKRQRVEPEKVIDFTNVKNIRNLGTLPIGNLVTVLPEEPKSKFYVRRKNPYRTPTPPNLSPTAPPVYKPRMTVQNVLNNLPPPAPSSKQQKEPPGNQNVERNLIDYSVLTKALTKTLESKLQEGEDNDVKIVIFCNNKPIQSFSVRSNAKQGVGAPPIPNLPPSMLPPASASLSNHATQKLLKMPVDTVTNVNDILAQNPTYLSKQINQNLGLSPNNIPTIGDVKAILERNRRIANESLAKFSTPRTKTKRIPDEHLAMLLKELQKSDSDTDNSALAEPKHSDSKKKDSNMGEDLEEKNLVINDSVTTDENCNGSVDEVQCDQCQKVFKQQRYLNRHKIRVHSSSKQAGQQSEQVSSPQEQSQPELVNNKTIEDLLATPSENTIGNANCIPHKDTNGTFEGEKLDGTVEELDTSIVKTEPVSEYEDQEIQKLLADDNVLNLLETADKNKRSLFNQESQPHGVCAKDLLNPNYKAKSYSYDYRPPVTEEGLVEPVYVCEQCGKFYRARKTLKDHFLREHAKDKDDEPLYLYITGNKYQCPICFNNYHSGSELVSHTKKHTGELRSVCKLCGKVYSSVHVLRRHIDNIHSDVKPRPFQCELCEYAASNKWHLKEHYRRHTGEQPYKCPVCVKSFSHQGTMNRHCKTIHKIEIPSQRPYVRNNILDLPDLPTDTAVADGIPTNEELNLLCSETELPENSSESEKDLDLDLSIVKTEPQEVDVE